ncbi:uncharacterized protein (TIGR02217 family) [Phyllobacterium myrsinacearum]|uniref:DUF2460 domain-containing protein n=1 Tax=Phyllobacterium myrsinacearum TaxID=28101 RepID=UPI001029693F|nr:DUF2460 domain-containing protein [Phyllobacterium myrsinacearum]RZS88562.1 uncharacterized protein (TIGR02217 family) [Phyllobacterium myrsinacearum]
MEAFHDARFPLGISFGATGGPEWKNEIVALTSGHEQRNARWASSRHHYDAGTGVRSLTDLETVLGFFEARRGSLYAFRFRDPFDHQSCAAGKPMTATDQHLGSGDGKQAVFQLQKRYGDYRRTITKPVPGSVRIAVAGLEKQEPADFTVDALTGQVMFKPDRVPPAGTDVTAGFAFDVPARFNADRLTVSIKSFKAGEIPTIPIIEVKT